MAGEGDGEQDKESQLNFKLCVFIFDLFSLYFLKTDSSCLKTSK